MLNQHNIEEKKLTIVVKIGTDAIMKSNGNSDEYGGPDEEVLNCLVDQLAFLKKQGHTVILVTSGAVGTGRADLEQPKLKDELLAEKQMYASIGQAVLISIYNKFLARHGMRAAQCLFEKRHFRNKKSTLEIDSANALDMILRREDVLPVVNENDTTSTYELKFSDNDQLAGLIATHCQADHLVLISSVGGVYSANPNADKNASLLPQLTLAQLKNIPTDGTSYNGSGGMSTKFKAAKRLLGKCRKSYVHVLPPLKNRPYILEALSNNNPGTVITSGRYKPMRSIAPFRATPRYAGLKIDSA